MTETCTTMILKAVDFIGSSKKDLLKMPLGIRGIFGYGLYLAQIGQQYEHTKTLQGFGSAKIVEIVERDNAGTYRAVYTVKFSDVVFVLHVFQKKSKSGIKTPKADMDLIRSRLREAEKKYEEYLKKR